jgi:hypothetical protein
MTMAKLPEIPSDFIEPYLVKYFGYIIDCVGYGLKSPDEAKKDLLGLERFISLFGGIHSKLAISNEYYRITKMSNAQFLSVCKKVVKESVADEIDYY